MSYKQNNPLSRKSSPLNKDDRWIQKATESIKERGTEGVCTGDKFGGPTCPPGSKRYNLAKTFKKMAKDRKGDPLENHLKNIICLLKTICIKEVKAIWECQDNLVHH